MEKRALSILGCGWVGNALKDLLEDEYVVNCLSKDIKSNKEANLYNVATIIIAIAPKENYLEVLKTTLSLISTNTQVVFLSSISFYKKRTLVVAGEELILKEAPKSVILRLGGLMGYDRVAGKYSSGKILQENLPTNYIHRDDVIHIIKKIIDEKISYEVFDVVAPIQSNLQEVYDMNANSFGFEKTFFQESEAFGSSYYPKKLLQKLQYSFLKEDVKSFWS